jgi:hypothetical protein
MECLEEEVGENCKHRPFSGSTGQASLACNLLREESFFLCCCAVWLDLVETKQ